MRKLLLLPILIFLLGFSAFSQDLIIESLETNESYYQHEGLSFSITIKNIGVLPTIYTNGSIYLSTDSETSSSGYITGFSIPILQPDESITISQNYGDENFRNYIDKNPGAYYALAKIRNDSNSDVNLDNNYYVGDMVNVLTPTTDLSISLNNSLDATYFQNDLISTSVTAINAGSPIYNCFVAAYLSTDQVLDSEDSRLSGRKNTTPFQYQNEVTSNLSYAVPHNQAVGEYYVIYKIDVKEQYLEVNESNNTVVSDLIEITESDIQLEISYAYADRDYNDDINLSFSIQNNGSTPANEYQYEVFWSMDGISLDYPAYIDSGGMVGEIKPNSSQSFYEELWDEPSFEDYPYLIIVNTNPQFPEIEPYSFYAPPPLPPANYNFNISDVYLSSPVETEDTEIPITIEIENPNDNSIYESATVDMTLESLDGQIVENYSIRTGVYMNEYGSDELNLSLPNRSSLVAGTYTVTTDITLNYESGGAGPFSSQIEIIASEYNIEVEIVGQNGDVLNQGIVYFYEKTTEGSINFLSSADIEEIDGVGKVSFLQSAGNYMFFVVPDKNEFPNYIRTVSGNTFKLEETSFTEINSDATIQIEPIYVDPNALNGSKIIQGNVVGGTASGKMAFNQAARASFDQTPVYLIQSSQVMAVTTTDASGAFTFSNVENGEYEVYFDDGDILESNDITANLTIDASTDIVNITINESGELSIKDLKMELDAFFLETRDVEADEDQLSIQYSLSNFYKNNDIAITDAFFYGYIKQNDVIIDSIAFEKDLMLSENDTLNIKKSLQLTSLLEIGEYEFELYFSTPYQDTEVIRSARTFDVIEPHYEIAVTAFDSRQSALSSGVIQLYKINESDQPVLFEEKIISQDGSASFNNPTCEYIIRVVPEKESYPNLIPSFHNQKYYFSEEHIQTLTADTEHQISLVNNPTQALNGNRKVVFELTDDHFYFDQTQVIIANAADSSVIKTAITEENRIEIENFESGEYVFFFDDEDIAMNHEKWYSLDINDQGDLYQIEISAPKTSLNQYDFDFVVKKDSVFNNYNNMDQLNMVLDIEKQSSVFPDDLLSVDFRIDLISTESRDSLSFFHSEMLDFNSFETLEKILHLDSFLDAGNYDVKVHYASQYTNGYVQSNVFPIKILDAGISLTKVQLQEELLENAKQIPLELQLDGSTDSLNNFKVYYEHKLIKGLDTIRIQNHQSVIEIGNEESQTYSYTLDLKNPLVLGDYKLLTNFNPHHKDETGQQLVETTFRVKNKRLSFAKLSLNEGISVISDEIDFSFSISANNDDSIKTQNTKLVSYIIDDNDTLIHNVEDFIVNIPRSGTEEFQSSIELKDHLKSYLNPGDYKLIVELQHPIAIYSKQSNINFRVKDPSIELLAIEIPEEISDKTSEIICEVEVSGNSNDIIRSLQTDFKVNILKNNKIVSDTVITQDLTIRKSGSISTNITMPSIHALEDGEYLFELSYITKYMSDYSAKISKEFTIFTESAVTSNQPALGLEYSIFPNPFVNHIKIEGGAFDNAFLYDQYGKLLKSHQKGNVIQDLRDINAGVYLLVIEYQGKSVYKKVLKE